MEYRSVPGLRYDGRVRIDLEPRRPSNQASLLDD
jgi:hypothetical protein